MKKLHVSFLRNLDNQEFRIFFFELLHYMENRKFKDPTLKTLLKRLQHHSDDVGNLKDSVERYKNTTKIRELSRLRTEYLISFRLEIKAKLFSCFPEKREVAQRLYLWLKNYKKKPYIQSISTQNIVIDNMFGCIDSDASLKADITLLYLDDLIIAIDETTKQINEEVKLRTLVKMSRPKKGRIVRDAAYEEIKTLTNYIDSQLSLLQGDVEQSEYYSILLDLHPKLKKAHKELKIRTAKNKSKKKKTAAKQLSVSKQEDERNLGASEGKINS